MANDELNEVSKETLSSYLSKSSSERYRLGNKHTLNNPYARMSPELKKRTKKDKIDKGKDASWVERKLGNRLQGEIRAKSKMSNEEIERQEIIKEASGEMLDVLLQGDAATAKQMFDQIVTAKISDQLDARRVKIASGLFSEGGEEDPSDEEEEIELTPEEQEFVDSLSDEEVEALLNSETEDEEEAELAEAFEVVDSAIDAWDELSEADKDEHLEGVHAFFEGYEAPEGTEWEVTNNQLNENWDKMSHEAKELVLHADNDYHLHQSSHQPIMANLKRKVKKGQYDHTKAHKLWQYHADRAAQSYTKHHGAPHEKWHKTFSTSARKEAAKHWADLHKDELHD